MQAIRRMWRSRSDVYHMRNNAYTVYIYIDHMRFTVAETLDAEMSKDKESRSEFGELEISNTAWAFTRIAVRDQRHGYSPVKPSDTGNAPQ